METFFETLKDRNASLFYFGLVCFLLGLVFLIATKYNNTKLLGVSVWYKPLKFALSIGIYVWTMAWFLVYLESPFEVVVFNWFTIVLLGFEIIYIAFQAGKGQLSHFNVSSTFYAAMYAAMAIAATIVTLWTGYFAIQFFKKDFPLLPDYYVLSIRFGLILFFIFSLEGFLMGSRMAHTIGGPDGSPGIPVLNWSKKFGDARVAHFFGMHALQILPLLSYFLIKNKIAILCIGLVYGLFCAMMLRNALRGKPFIK